MEQQTVCICKICNKFTNNVHMMMSRTKIPKGFLCDICYQNFKNKLIGGI